MTPQQLKTDFETVVNNYITFFCEKQDGDFLGWVGNNVGEWADIGDITLMFDDIRLDIDENAPKGEILKWHNAQVDKHFRDNNFDEDINYRNWLKGVR